METQPRSERGEVLLIEDDSTVRAVLGLLLESAGWIVEEASDGRIGLLIARRRDADLALIVTDLRMPGLSGLDVARELTNGEDHPPLIAITSDTSALRDTAEASGCFEAVLTKPVEPESFLTAVRTAARV